MCVASARDKDSMSQTGGIVTAVLSVILGRRTNLIALQALSTLSAGHKEDSKWRASLSVTSTTK